MRLSVIIPVFNEEETLKDIIGKVKKAKLPEEIRREIIVVDDASTDASLKIAKGIKNIKVLTHKRNLGKGAALRTGISKVKGDIILIQDADLEYDPKDYFKLLTPIVNEKSKVVFGTRLKNYPLKLFGKRKTPLVLHYLGNKLLTFITNLLYGDGVTDMETCYKVFKREVLDGITINTNGFDFEPEFTAKIIKKGYKIHEVPIKVKPRGYDDGKKITWRDGFLALWTLVKYRFVD